MLYYYPGPICAYYLSRRILSRNVNWRITVYIWQSITSGFPWSSLHFIHKDRAWDPESLLRGLLGPDTVTSSGGPGWSRCPGSRQVGSAHVGGSESCMLARAQAGPSPVTVAAPGGGQRLADGLRLVGPGRSLAVTNRLEMCNPLAERPEPVHLSPAHRAWFKFVTGKKLKPSARADRRRAGKLRELLCAEWSRSSKPWKPNHKVPFLYIMNIIMIHFIYECQSTLMRALVRMVIFQPFQPD